MKKRNSRALGILLSIVLQPLLSCRQEAPEKPNIIFILTDDHRWDALGARGNAIIRTPSQIPTRSCCGTPDIRQTSSGKYGVGNPEDQPKDQYDFWDCSPTGQPIYEMTDEEGNYLHHTDKVDQEAKSETQFRIQTKQPLTQQRSCPTRRYKPQRILLRLR